MLTQDRKCKYNVRLRCFRATTVAVEKQKELYIASVCVFVAFGTQCAMRMCHIIYGLSGPNTLSHIISQMVRISKKKTLLNIKLCFDFLYNFCLKHVSF